MNTIIGQLQANSDFFEEYTDEIHPYFCNILMDDFEWEGKEIHDTVVYTVLEAHFARLFARTNRRTTRTTLSVMDKAL